jgi:hypothetical protein
MMGICCGFSLHVMIIRMGKIMEREDGQDGEKNGG